MCSLPLLLIHTFQSTLPREERRGRAIRGQSYYVFQSTLPREERLNLSEGDMPDFTFQSTLPREERLLTLWLWTLTCRFQSTLPREERLSSCWKLPRKNYFNPRSHERSDYVHSSIMSIDKNFNPRSHERSDSNIAQKICLFLYNTDNKYIIR